MTTGRQPSQPPARAGRVRRVLGSNGHSPLPPGATVNFSVERRSAGVDDVLAALDKDLVGLSDVKERMQEVAALLLVDRARQRFGLTAPRPTLHMCFTGSPGTGKTTVGLRMAELLHRLGYLEKGHLVVAMRDDLVGPYVGQRSNPGMRSRVAHHLDFADYDMGELQAIGELILERSGFYLSEDAKAAFVDHLRHSRATAAFANARSVRNAVERARFQHAKRLLADSQRAWSWDDLMRIEAEDVAADE